jgi:trimeric autotransporter adhesin
MLGIFVLLALLAGGLVSCGGNGGGSGGGGTGNPGTTTGSYTITVTGTSGSIMQTTTAALTVN